MRDPIALRELESLMRTTQGEQSGSSQPLGSQRLKLETQRTLGAQRESAAFKFCHSGIFSAIFASSAFPEQRRRQ